MGEVCFFFLRHDGHVQRFPILYPGNEHIDVGVDARRFGGLDSRPVFTPRMRVCFSLAVRNES
jgi:hypothetical protein